MFINIDYNKRPQKAKLHLAKPSKRVVSHISEKIKDSLKIKLGDINELEFSIPHYIEGQKNKHVDLIKEKMYIRITLGSYTEWYIVDEIEEDGDDSDIFNVKCFSLSYELKGKRVDDIERDGVNAENLLREIMEGRTTSWRIGEIDPIFNNMYRSFKISDSNVLDSIIQAGETYGALIVWNTVSRTVSFKDLNKNGKFRGMTINYGKFLRSIRRTRTADEMITRLYIEGSEGLTIHKVNPTGQGYIEDYSYYMFPFKRENGVVVESSHFMSDELCIALEEHQLKIEMHSNEIKALTDNILLEETTLITKQNELTQLNLEMETILALLDTAQSTGDSRLITQRKNERNAKQIEITNKNDEIRRIGNRITSYENQLQLRHNDITYDTNFTQELLDELDLFIFESKWKDDRYTDVNELYEDGVKKFKELQQPKVVIDVTIDNLMNIIEEQYYWDKLVLGDLIKVKYPQMNIEYMAKIIEIDYDLENGEATLTIANTSDLLDENDKLVQLLYSSSNATSIIQNNKYKWDKINAVEREVNAIISQEWNANKNKIIAGVNNTIEVGNRGIIIKNPDFPQEVVIMQSGIIALSKDGGETWKTAIKPDGIVAERLIGQIIAGQELIITNSAGSFTFDNNGVFIDANVFELRTSRGNQSVNLMDVWNGTSNFVDAFVDDNIITPYEKKMMKQEWERLLELYNSSITKLGIYYTDSGNSIPDVVAYHQSYQTLYNYLFEDEQTDGYALLDNNNLSSSTRINRNVYQNTWKDYYEKRTKLDELLLIRAKSFTDETKEEVLQNIRELEDDIVWKIEIHSSNGFLFKNNIISTTLTAHVFRGMDNVTSTLSSNSFIWRKFDKNGVEDLTWFNRNRGIGNIIHLTGDDIQSKATFKCDISID